MCSHEHIVLNKSDHFGRRNSLDCLESRIVSCRADEMPVVPNDESIDGLTVASDGLPARESGGWIETKHHYLDRYCGIFSTGMKNRWAKRVFIDVMAGPGICKIRDTGQEMDGSPLIALKHPFTDYTFVENHPISCDALKKRVNDHPKKNLVK